jgi:hypothetical protein
MAPPGDGLGAGMLRAGMSPAPASEVGWVYRFDGP